MSISHHQIFDASLGIAMVQKMTYRWKGLTIFYVFIIVDMKCDTSVTGKIGCFGSTFGHLAYQNHESEGCMLSTLSQGMSQNSFHH